MQPRSAQEIMRSMTSAKKKQDVLGKHVDIISMDASVERDYQVPFRWSVYLTKFLRQSFQKEVCLLNAFLEIT